VKDLVAMYETARLHEVRRCARSPLEQAACDRAAAVLKKMN
jgi:hypothetical protein